MYRAQKITTKRLLDEVFSWKKKRARGYNNSTRKKKN